MFSQSPYLSFRLFTQFCAYMIFWPVIVKYSNINLNMHIEPPKISVTRGIFWPRPFTGSPSCFLLIWYFLIPEVGGKPPLTSSKFGWPSLLPCGLPAPLELGDLHKRVQAWAEKLSLPTQPWSGIGHQRNILASTFHRVSPCFLLIRNFLITRGWWKPPLTSSKLAVLVWHQKRSARNVWTAIRFQPLTVKCHHWRLCLRVKVYPAPYKQQK